MIYLIKFLYSWFIPPGIFILLFALIAFATRKTQKLWSKLVLAATLLLYLLSTTLVSDMLIHSLESRYTPPAQLDGDVLVMLGGGALLDVPDIDGMGQLSGPAANRLLTVARLHRVTGMPIIVSGGQVYEFTGNEAQIAKRQLIGLGIASDKIITEDKSRTTTENAMLVKDKLADYGFKKPVLITSAFHMERSMHNFERVGVAAIPYPTDYNTNRELKFDINKLIPNNSALYNSITAMREYLGLFALRVQAGQVQ